MKQLIFLLLFPCLAMAQYQGNGNQKITLGEQTSADGLVYRGLAADTTRKPSVDTMAFILLDTNTNIIWQYKKATNNAWTRVGGSISSGLTGFLPVANGGTGSTSFSPNNYLIRTNSSGNFDTSAIYEANGNVGVGVIPSSWGTSTFGPNTKIIEISQNGSFVGAGAGGLLFGNNLNGNNNNYLYARTDFPSSFYTIQTSDNKNIWSMAPSGTAGSIMTPTQVMVLTSAGNLGIGQTNPTAVLHLKAGTATAGTAPLKFTSGVNLTSPLGGEMEFNGTNLFFSPSTTRHTVNHGLTGSATLEFLSTNAQNSRDMTITVTGAADGDVVSLGVPNAAVNANTCYTAWVSAANTVTVRFNNYSSGTVDPASGLFKVFVTK